MAKDPKKDEPKKRLSFFKKAKQEPDEAEKPEKTDRLEAPDGPEEPGKSEKPEKPERPEKAERPMKDEEVEATAAQAEGSHREQVEKDAETTEVPAEVSEPPAPKRSGKTLLPAFLPTLSLAVRSLVILAIVIADAYAAYFLVVRVIGPNLAMAKVAQVRESVRPREKHIEPVEVEIPKSEAAEENVMGTVNLIEDLVVNPAGSEGTRYLCTTVALESIQPGVAEEITSREAQVRDALLEILGKRTVMELATLDTRDQIREEIKVAVNGLLSTGSVVGVYFSNFVLQ